MKIPKSITVITGEQHRVYGLIDTFFGETKREILRKGYLDGPYFEIRAMGCSNESGQVTDNRTHHLIYKGAVAATVIETRTDFNNIRFDFFKNLDNLLDVKS